MSTLSPRFAIATSAAILSLATLAAPVSSALAAQDRADGPYFAAQLVEPTEEATAIAGGVVFLCEGASCTGPRSGDRPLRVCSDLRRAVGPVASFAVRGEAMTASQLARCNG